MTQQQVTWRHFLNNKLQHLSIKARANMRVELSNLTTTGTVEFKIEGDNDTPIAISASVVPSDLTNLVTALNDQSSRDWDYRKLIQ